MPYTVGIASDYYNMLERLRRYLTGFKSIENEQANAGNTGDGYLRDLTTDVNAVAETITVACTVAGGDGVATFSVTGSVSGPMGNTVAGDWFTDAGSKVILIMRAGPTDWIIGDSYTFDIVDNDIPGAQQWTELKWSPGVRSVTNNGMNYTPYNALYSNELYLKGPGLAGQDEVFVHLCSFSSESSDYYNLAFRSSIGFETLEDWDHQPVDSTATTLCLWQFQLKYWIVANGRRFILVTNLESPGVYMSTYCGLFLPYGTPQEYPYPMYCAAGSGFTGLSGTRWSSESHNHRSFFDPYAGYLYTVEGTWLTIQNKYSSSGNETNNSTSNVWPYEAGLINGIRQSPGDVYPLLPLVVHTTDNGDNVYGELEGCFWTPGFANASENEIVIGGTNYLVVQNVYRTSNGDYFALKLE